MNKIKVSGVVATPLTLSHEVHGEKFYEFMLNTERKSGNTDSLVCHISEVFANKVVEGDAIAIIGEIRTHNVVDESGKNHCYIYVFCKEICDFEYHDNEVTLSGYTCRTPNYRQTPLGRQITDFLVACNRDNKYKSDYIPAICWGRNALRIQNVPIGTKVDIVGRLQSREYTKKLSDGAEVIKVAYELSVAKIIVDDSEVQYES